AVLTIIFICAVLGALFYVWRDDNNDERD
ncbi:hypothetical protein LCGC14_2804840, partial [marine sediment metagenome]